MPARFEVRRGILPTRKRWRWVLIASNSEPVAIGEHYNSRDACLGGIQAVRDAVVDADVVDTTQ